MKKSIQRAPVKVHFSDDTPDKLPERD